LETWDDTWNQYVPAPRLPLVHEVPETVEAMTENPAEDEVVES